jgi:putative salt-induced outer membrane protein YdiY
MATISYTAPTVTAPKKPKTAWNHSLSAGATLARGNTDTTLISADYTAVKKTPKDEYNGMLGMAYGEQDNKQTADNYKGSFQWNHLFTTNNYGYLRAEALRDYISDVDYRFTVGPGLGHYLIKGTNTTFAVGGGVNFEGQSLGNQGDTFATFRLADKFEQKINNHARIWQIVEFLPQVDRLQNYLVNFEVGAEAPFTKSLSLKAYLDDNFDSRPALDHVKNDVRLVTGMAFKF